MAYILELPLGKLTLNNYISQKGFIPSNVVTYEDVYANVTGSWVCTIRVSFPDQETVVAQSPLGLLNWRKKEAQNLAAQLAFEMITRNDPNYQRD
jgi:hypothetical protein